MNIHKIYKIFLKYFRRTRMLSFIKQFNPTCDTNIIDVGGGAYNWEIIKCKSKVTILNLVLPNNIMSYSSNYNFIVGNGMRLKFSDKSFDIGYSNSVIEHLGSLKNQIKFANEIRRVSTKLWVQTPAMSFFVEPHLITPFIHYLPKRIQKKLLRNFTLWGVVTRPSKDETENFIREVRLLNLQEMEKLFPDCVIQKEKFWGFTKSYIAVKV